MKEIVIKVKGMVCGGCENRVQNALKMINGVENVVANHTTETVTIAVNDEVSKNILEEKIEDLGFEVVKEN